MTHTESDLRAWWQVDLGQPTDLGKIVLHNRTDAHGERLASFDVLTSYDGIDWDVAATYGGAAGPRTTLSLLAHAQYVRVQLRGTDYLSLAEVQLFAPVNFALGRPATQSSTATAATGPANAVDGDTRATAPIARTASEAAAWWTVDLGTETDLGEIVIVSRDDSPLADFDILISDDNIHWGTHYSHDGPAGSRVFALLAARGRYVQIRRRTPGTISLTEVQLYPMKNVALGKRATQSITPGWGGPAARAVDGNPDGAWTNGSVTHTDRLASPTWQVDLGADTFISTVVLHNRTDQWGERLANFVLEVSDDGTTWETIESHPGVAGATAQFVPDVFARHLRVRLLGTDYLSLAEVEIHL